MDSPTAHDASPKTYRMWDAGSLNQLTIKPTNMSAVPTTKAAAIVPVLAEPAASALASASTVIS